MDQNFGIMTKQRRPDPWLEYVAKCQAAGKKISYRNFKPPPDDEPPPPPRELFVTYNDELKDLGKVQTNKGEELVLREYVYSSLWSKVKFVLCDSELDFEGALARKVMKDVCVTKSMEREYWLRNRNKVLKFINQKRNNTIGAVKREFIRKFIYALA